MRDAYSTVDVCEMIGATMDDIRHLHERGRLPLPGKWAGRRAYTAKEVTEMRRVLGLSRLPQGGAVARDLGVTLQQVREAWVSGKVPAPQYKYGKWAVYTTDEVDALRRHFNEVTV